MKAVMLCSRYTNYMFYTVSILSVLRAQYAYTLLTYRLVCNNDILFKRYGARIQQLQEWLNNA